GRYDGVQSGSWPDRSPARYPERPSTATRAIAGAQYCSGIDCQRYAFDLQQGRLTMPSDPGRPGTTPAIPGCTPASEWEPQRRDTGPVQRPERAWYASARRLACGRPERPTSAGDVPRYPDTHATTSHH